MVTDSVSCLPKELVKEYGIRVVPLSLIINGSIYRDGICIGGGGSLERADKISIQVC